jgi:hypothetical protein
MAVEAMAEKDAGGAAGGVAPESSVAAGGERLSPFRRICVYCGSAKGRKASYQDAAVELGKELVRNQINPTPQNPSFHASKPRENQIRRRGSPGPAGLKFCSSQK